MNLVNRLAVPVLLVASSASAGAPIMRINGEDVARFRLEFATRAILEQGAAQKLPPEEVTRRAVDQIIARAILVQAARDAKIKADPEAVKKALDMQRAQFATPAAFNKMLTEVGITEADLTTLEEERNMIQRFVETTIMPTITVTDDEARAYVAKHPEEFKHPEQVKVRMILVQVPEGADAATVAAAKAKADAALARVQKGEDFARVASQLSDDRSKANGGDVGWVHRGMLLPDLDAPVFALKVGGITPVIKTKYGFQILRVDDRRDAGVFTADEVRDRVRGYLRELRTREAVQKLVAERRAVAKIEALDPEVKAALSPVAPGGSSSAAPQASSKPGKTGAGAVATPQK